MSEVKDEIVFKLTMDESNELLSALGQAPANASMNSIQRLMEQGRPQAQLIEEAMAAAEEAAETEAAE